MAKGMAQIGTKYKGCSQQTEMMGVHTYNLVAWENLFCAEGTRHIGTAFITLQVYATRQGVDSVKSF